MRLKLGVASLLVLGVTAAFAVLPSVGTASGGTSASESSLPTTNTWWDPQTTNVPYLAWAGEQVRLEKCVYVDGLTADTDLGGLNLDVLVEDWSGDPNNKPQIEPSTVKLFYAQGELCGMADAISLYPGFARIEADVVVNAGKGWLGYGPAQTVIKHQFLSGWMTLNQPTLTELSSSSFASTAQAEAAKELGDPSGNGEFTAGDKPGYLSVKVTGSIPLNGAWASLVGQSSVTLPNDWALLANKLATNDNPADSQAVAAQQWDISNDPTGDFGHVPQSPSCGPPGPETAGAPAAPPGTDSVDDCTGGGADGPFSTQFGLLSSDSSIGPFDPVRAGDTLLPNGVLDANDAPMPAARIDVTIAPNSGMPGDTSGVGYLAPADKTKTYSRNFLGPDGLNDNEYAPFYDQYIPATAAGDISSGVDGAFANNFNGFLVDGEYHNWDFASTLASNAGTATSCLERSAYPSTDSPTKNPYDYYQTPSGPSSVAVYTDNHGEAQVQYVPGFGFYFDSLIKNNAAITNADGGCDLQSLMGVPDSLGSATITATARYPFKPTDFADIASASITKSVTSEWSKTLAYDPKGPGAANNNSRIVIAHAQNIDGSPFTHERVCFSSNGESTQLFSGTVGTPPITVTTTPASAPNGSQGLTCGYTDANGNAAVEVLESDPVMVNVVADFTNEGILRSISVDYMTPGSSGGTPPPTPGSGSTGPTGGSNSGTTPPSPGVLRAVAPTLVTTSSVSGASSHTRVVLLRLDSPVHGKRFVFIRVASKSHKVKIRLRLIKNHRMITVTGTITANKLVKIQVPKSVTRIVSVRVL
jgi:hypothetical protein